MELFKIWSKTENSNSMCTTLHTTVKVHLDTILLIRSLKFEILFSERFLEVFYKVLRLISKVILYF